MGFGVRAANLREVGVGGSPTSGRRLTTVGSRVCVRRTANTQSGGTCKISVAALPLTHSYQHGCHPEHAPTRACAVHGLPQCPSCRSSLGERATCRSGQHGVGRCAPRDDTSAALSVVLAPCLRILDFGDQPSHSTSPQTKTSPPAAAAWTCCLAGPKCLRSRTCRSPPAQPAPPCGTSSLGCAAAC